jgi:hypothetical protein
MIYIEKVLADAKDLATEEIARRNGVSVKEIVLLDPPSPHFQALAQALINAINRELEGL